MAPPTPDLADLGKRHLYGNYRQPPIVFVRGEGCRLWDADGKEYLDLFAGIAVSTLGHSHPALVRAVSEQAGKLLHLSNYYYNEPNVLLARRLCDLSGMDRVFFCNSGTEANEAVLKLARRHFFGQGKKEKQRIIAFEKSFHGRTLGALAATGQPGYRDGFGPLPGVTHVPYGDVDAVRAALGEDVAGILVEPVQGEGGVVPAPDGFLRSLRSLADDHQILLLGDEVQTGVGRTGKFLGCMHDDIQFDALALAKALGGGVPIGAMLCRANVQDALPPGSHGSTFGGNPLASAAANAVLDVVESDNLMEHAARLGTYLAERLNELAKKHSTAVSGARGRGLLQALVLKDSLDPREVLGNLCDRGVLLTAAGGCALRFTPPLVITQAELDQGLTAVDQVLGELA